ncbi:MAG: Formate--tetrahydrofolate ligase, partial [Candidatus Thermoplasmatota archaeon]|nr:Formate--tetrahydrofolate ligase [Candidatus Thermoplasmatota archaeon]
VYRLRGADVRALGALALLEMQAFPLVDPVYPGLPTVPAAERINIDDKGYITGLN